MGRCIISEYHEVEIKFKDENILLESLKEMGYNPKVHNEATSLYGYQGDKREQKAHIVIPRKQVGGASNDVGFERTKKGFTLHASEYDKQWRSGNKIKTLNKTYTEKKLKKVVDGSIKYNISNRAVRKDGRIEIHLRIN
jgi:hypothetical protein